MTSKYLAAATALALAVGGLLLSGLPAQAEDGANTLYSSDVSDGTALNPMFACTAGGFIPTGGQVSPQLDLELSTGTAQTLALIMHDEFGADQRYSAGDWAHWVVYNMDPTQTLTLPRDASQTGAVLGGVQAQNSWGETGYRGPCPPPGGTHTYYFTVYSLDNTLPTTIANADQLMAAMAGHITNQGDVAVTFTTAEIGDNRAEIEFGTGVWGDVNEDAGTVPLPSLLVNGIVGQASTVTLELSDECATPADGAPATAVDDYSYTDPRTVTLSIPAGTYDGTAATAITIPGTFTVTDDALDEGTECALWTITAAAGDAVIGDAGHQQRSGLGTSGAIQATTALSILDNDEPPVGAPVVELSASSATAAEGDGTVAPVLILVNGVVAQETTVTLAVAGTATAGTDFTSPATITVTIPAGTYDGTAATGIRADGITITDDSAVEDDETVTFTLTAGIGLGLGDADGNEATTSLLTLTLADNDEESTPTPTPTPTASAPTAPAANAPSAALASTGLGTTGAGWVAGGALIIGAVLTVVAFRRIQATRQ